VDRLNENETMWYVWDEDQWREREEYEHGTEGRRIYARDAKEAAERWADEVFADYDYKVAAYEVIVVQALPVPDYNNPKQFTLETDIVAEHHATEVDRQ